MTSEQIAELRKGYEERSRDDLDAEADEVLKLLDEREALLEAVSNVADSILLYEKTPDEVVTGAMLADLGRILRAVRTKAGSP